MPTGSRTMAGGQPAAAAAPGGRRELDPSGARRGARAPCLPRALDASSSASAASAPVRRLDRARHRRRGDRRHPPVITTITARRVAPVPEHAAPSPTSAAGVRQRRRHPRRRPGGLPARGRPSSTPPTSRATCRWPLLAAIGRVESNHGRYAGSALDAERGRDTGDPRCPPRRPRRHHPDPGHATPGELDGDPRFDRAVGPMQFIPSTWSVRRAWTPTATAGATPRTSTTPPCRPPSTCASARTT